MKEVKDIILEKRIKELKVDGKKIPQIYIDVFNNYLEEIAEEFSNYTCNVDEHLDNKSAK